MPNRSTTRRPRGGWLRPAVCALLLLPGQASAAHSSPSAADSIVLDGAKDAAYTLLAEDDPADLAVTADEAPYSAWAELSELYVASDEDNLYVYVPLPHFSQATASGTIGLVIDTNGDIAASVPITDPWGAAITFAYTGTVALGQAPVPSTHVRRPEVVIRGNVPGVLDDFPNENNGYSTLSAWAGDHWETVHNWGGIIGGELVGTRMAYSNDPGGVELAIPFADLGVPAGSALALQFFTTKTKLGDKFIYGAFDTVPSDSQVEAPTDATTQRVLAALGPVSGPGGVSVAFSHTAYTAPEADPAAPITVTLAASHALTVTVGYSATAGTASPDDFTPTSDTLTFPPGVTTRTFSVILHDDDLVEGAETVQLALSAPQEAVLGDPATALLTLLDDDAPNWRILLPLLRR